MSTMVEEKPATIRTADDPPPPAGFTPYRYGEDFTDTESEGLCWDMTILADRVFVCVAPYDHVEADHNAHRGETHGWVRMHRDPSVTFSQTAQSLEDDIP